MHHRILLGFAAALVVAACGSSNEASEKAAPETAEPNADEASADQDTADVGACAPTRGGTIDIGAAQRLPATTAGALTIPRPSGAVRDIVRSLGHDIGPLDGATSITIAWLEPPMRQLVAITSYPDKPAIAVPFGNDIEDTRRALAEVTPDASLYASKKLHVFADIRFGDDAALYIDVERHGLRGGGTIAAGLAIEPDAVVARALVTFGGTTLDATAWSDTLARALGGDAATSSPVTTYGTPAATMPVASVIARVLGTDHPFGDKLADAVIAGEQTATGLVYCGGIAFPNSSVAELTELASSFASAREYDRTTVAAREKLEAMQGGAFAILSAEGSLSSDIDYVDGLGGLFGDDIAVLGDGYGFGEGGIGEGGLGLYGTGTGDDDTVGYGTIGHGAGAGGGYGVGGGRIGGGTSGRVRSGTLTVDGDLDESIVRRTIRQKIHEVRTCYEQALTDDPSLSGTVHVSFTIGTDGAVRDVQGEGMSYAVSSCVAGVVEALQFPTPKRGVVNVNQSFVFHSE